MSYLLGQMEATHIIAKAMSETAQEILQQERNSPNGPRLEALASALTVNMIGMALFTASERMAEKMREQTGGANS